MNVRFNPEAVSELNAAVDYYEENEAGLGIEFVMEIQKGIEMILKYPDSWQQISFSSRRYLVKRFPLGIIFLCNDGTLYIVAIMNLNREPNYWKKRKTV